MNKSRLLLIIAWFLCLLGIVLAGSTYKSWTRLTQGIDRRTNDLAYLEKLNQQKEQREEAVDTYANALQASSTTSLKNLLNQHTPTATYEMRTSQHPSNISGWQIEQTELTFSDVPLAELGALVQTCAASTPPLKILKIDLRATPETDRGTASLLLERILQHTE